MTQLILTHPPLSPTWTDSQIALHIVQMLFIFFTLIRQCVCGGAVCGRPSLQRNIWNGSKVYEVAAVNPVDVPQLFFSFKRSGHSFWTSTHRVYIFCCMWLWRNCSGFFSFGSLLSSHPSVCMCTAVWIRAGCGCQVISMLLIKIQ